MSLHADPALVITDGGLASLLACYIEGVCKPAAKLDGEATRAKGAPLRSAAWLGIGTDQLGQREWRKSAALRACQICHMNELIESDTPEPARGTTPVRSSTGPERTRLLMAAGAEAVRRGFSRVVWPIHLGGPGTGSQRESEASRVVSDIADACDRAIVTARLLTIDIPVSGTSDHLDDGLVIQTPFVDFTDEQIADLAADVDLPIEAAYFGSSDAEKERWRTALTAVGLPMPIINHHGLSPTVAGTGTGRAASI